MFTYAFHFWLHGTAPAYAVVLTGVVESIKGLFLMPLTFLIEKKQMPYKCYVYLFKHLVFRPPFTSPVF